MNKLFWTRKFTTNVFLISKIRNNLNAHQQEI